MGKIVKFSLLSFFVIGLLSLFLMLGFHPTKANAQNGTPELVLFLVANSATPFEDLSGRNHPIIQIPGVAGDNVQITGDTELGKSVYSFTDGAYLEIPDLYGLLKLSSADELTIEVSANFAGVLPAANPLNQMIFSKGYISSYPRNYSFLVSWSDCSSSCFPGLNFGISGFGGGFYGPDGTNFLQGWKVYAFRVHKSEGQSNLTIECYINGQLDFTISYIPTNELSNNVYDGQGNLPPFNLGNGYSTVPGDQEFQPNPFYGKINYIRVYKGLLPEDQLNDNPLGDIPCFSQTNLPPTVHNQAVSTDQDSEVSIALSASDPNCDELTFHIESQPAHGSVVLSGSTSIYTPDPGYTGTDSFTYKANDGTSDSNTATVSINVKVGPELILALSASSGAPFQDLSEIHHPVVRIAGDQAGQVFIDWDADLGRNVYSFANGGYLSIPDILGLLSLTSEDEMTIEISVKITETDPGFHCGEPQLPIVNPIPDQKIFSKGLLAPDHIYSLGFAWGRDDMRRETCDPVGYFPGVGFSISWTSGIDNPMNTSDLAGWRVYSFLMSKDNNDPNQGMAWCYTNRNDNPYPATYSLSYVDNNQNDSPLVIGNGYATNGTNQFQPNPFFGKIDYIRIYKGLLPVEELNDNPSNLPEFPVPPNQPPVAVCQDVTVEATENCQAQVSIDAGSYDPEGGAITLAQNPPGPYSSGDPVLVTLIVTDDQGLSSSCNATVTVTDQDTDGDGIGDSCDPDIDNDNILNEIDLDPYVISDTFSDINIGGSTQGIILSRGGQTLTIEDSPNPNKGILMAASGLEGAIPALVSMCGGIAELTLDSGDRTTVTCGSVLIEVINGPVYITYFDSEGFPVTTSLDDENGLLFEPNTFTFTAPSTNTYLTFILIGEEELSLEPGKSIIWISIDIKPGGLPIKNNPKSKGKTLVAILSSASFDAFTQVNKTSLTFGASGNEESLAFCSEDPEDINGDGYLDLLCHFYSTLTGFKESDDKGILKGTTASGMPFEGRDVLRIVGKKKK